MELKDLLIDNEILSDILAICDSKFDSKHVTNFYYNETTKDYPIYQYISMLATTSFTLSNLCRYSPPPIIKQLELILQCIIKLMNRGINFIQNKEYFSNNKMAKQINNMLSDSALATKLLTGFKFDHVNYNCNDYIAKRLSEAGILQEFVNLMDNDDKVLRNRCIRVVGNILTGSAEYTHTFIELGILKKYRTVLDRLKAEIMSFNEDTRAQCESMQRICYLSEKIPLFIELVIDSGIVPKLIEFAKDHNHPYLQDRSLSILISVSCENKEYFITNDFHIILIDLLEESMEFKVIERTMYDSTVSI